MRFARLQGRSARLYRRSRVGQRAFFTSIPNTERNVKINRLKQVWVGDVTYSTDRCVPPIRTKPMMHTMNPISMALLASLFTWAGALIGTPSITFLVLYALYKARATVGANVGTNFGTNPDALMLMLKGLSTAIACIAGLVGSAVQWVSNALAIAAAAGLVLAVVCWCTGRGLAVQATWARFSAGLLLTVVLLSSLLLALSMHTLARMLMLALVGFCLFAMHTLWAGYAPRMP